MLLQETQELERTIIEFTTTLMPLDQLDVVSMDDKHTLLVAHVLAHTALVQLYRPLAQDDPIMFDKCARSARACVAVIKHISERDYKYLDPIVGVSLHYHPCLMRYSRLEKALLVVCCRHSHNRARNTGIHVDCSGA